MKHHYFLRITTFFLSLIYCVYVLTVISSFPDDYFFTTLSNFISVYISCFTVFCFTTPKDMQLLHIQGVN